MTTDIIDMTSHIVMYSKRQYFCTHLIIDFSRNRNPVNDRKYSALTKYYILTYEQNEDEMKKLMNLIAVISDNHLIQHNMMFKLARVREKNNFPFSPVRTALAGRASHFQAIFV